MIYFGDTPPLNCKIGKRWFPLPENVKSGLDYRGYWVHRTYRDFTNAEWQRMYEWSVNERFKNNNICQ
jgi:hypothetical protein